MQFYAHTQGPNKADWEPLFTTDCPALYEKDCPDCTDLHPQHGHLNKVAHLTSQFAADMLPKGPDRDAVQQWGYLVGLWHDLGKFAPDWQKYLASNADPHSADTSGKLDHSTAGAKQAIKAHPILGHLLGYPIAGHHSGLLDGTSNGACLRVRLEKDDLPDWSNSPDALTSLAIPNIPKFLTQESFGISLFTRMIFSCLVDADFLATEAFMNSAQAKVRNQVPSGILKSISKLVDEKIDSFPQPSPTDEVNKQRRKVVENCRSASHLPQGLFTLTVPTGGGKTLSSLSFALRHALTHGQKRVIYVVPFTSIIEQNAEVIREIVDPLTSDFFTPLIEHHSSLSPEKETTQSRLAAENWDAPIVITTSVQFYESLFAAKTSRSRKLHNIANSVVILDEAQSLPVDFLSPCLRVLQELSDHYHTTTVLCTATQPAVHYNEEQFPIGLKNCREIISDTSSLFGALKRVKVEPLGPISDTSLVDQLKQQEQALCIVNRRKHAQEIFQLLGGSEEHYHLSALMCPEHRSQILTTIRNRLVKKLPTQLIEAGVDVDFPTVFRALAGLDSIAQAAGRCNRNGKLEQPGNTYIFEPEDQNAETYFRETAQVAYQLLDLYPDLLSQEAMHHYFDLYYYRQSKRWDAKDILENFRLDQSNRKLPFDFNFATAAKNFRLIDDWQVPVIIPFDKKAKLLIEELENEFKPLHRNLLRGLQRYTVQIPPRLRDDNIQSFKAVREDQFHVLISDSLNYSKHFGLVFGEEYTNSQTLIS